MSTEFERLRKMAQAGDADAQFQFALQLDNGELSSRDPVAAANWYRFAAEQGHPQAQLHLGLMLNSGDTGFERDDSAAADWFRKAAEQGVADAQFNLALMHYNAEGVEQDDAAAADWFRKAAEQGNAKAQFNLGALYVNGHGVEQDNVMGYQWWLLAVMQGEPNANNNIGIAREKISTDEALAAEAAAVEWANRFQARAAAD